jgi:DNA replication protein DnaC
MSARDKRRRRAAVARDDSVSVGDLIASVQSKAEAHAEEYDDFPDDYDPDRLARIHAHRQRENERRAMPPLYRAMTFDAFDPQTEGQWSAYRACLAFVGAFLDDEPRELPNGLALLGEAGRGKTALAVAILNALHRPPTTVYICEVSEWMADIRASYGDGSSRSTELLHDAKTADFLLLDDIGKERETPHSVEMLYLVINHRIKYQLPTLLTSNLSPTEFMTRADGNLPRTYGGDPVYCQAIYSRLRQFVVGNVHVMDGADYRLKGGNR